MEPVRVLCIDGGGIRGVIPARVLDAVERFAGRPIHELFDLVAGTSTGALIAMAITAPQPLSGQDLVELYRLHGRTIFPHTRLRVKSVPLREYSPGALERVATEYIGGGSLSDLRVDVMVPAYELERRTPFFFKSWRAVERPQWDFPLVDVVLAACAAPLYFPPHKIVPRGERTRGYTLIDGGIFANNPAVSAIVECRKRWPQRPITMLALDTGGHVRRYPAEDAQDWGLFDWAGRVIDIVFDASSDSVTYQAARAQGVDYLRVQTEIPRGTTDLDDADPENVAALIQAADDAVRRQASTLEHMLSQLAPAET